MKAYQIAHLTQNLPEWSHAWDLLAKITGAGDYAETHHTSGEAWQYMGSVPANANDPGGRWVHQFRHRDHPKTGRREYVETPASWSWTRDEIERRAIAERAEANDRAALCAA